MIDPEFVAKAVLKIDEALVAGDKLCSHCLHCGQCKHHGDDEISVTMCDEAKLLNLRWELLKDEALPLVEAIKKHASDQTE